MTTHDDDFFFDPSEMSQEEKTRAMEGGNRNVDLPAGFYKVICDGFRMVTQQNGDRSMILALKVLEGDYADAKFDEWITIQGSEVRVGISKQQCLRIAHAVWNDERGFRGADLVDKVFGINRIASKKDGKEYKNNYVCSVDEYEKKKNLPVKAPTERKTAPKAAATASAAKGSEINDADVPF